MKYKYYNTKEVNEYNDYEKNEGRYELSKHILLYRVYDSRKT
jgi:hypothetical protein